MKVAEFPTQLYEIPLSRPGIVQLCRFGHCERLASLRIWMALRILDWKDIR